MGEVRRRLVHVSGAAVPLAYVVGLLTWGQLQVLVIGGSLLTVVLEAVRLSGRAPPWMDEFYDALTREYEQENLAGYALYVFSGTFVVLAFGPPDEGIAVASVLMLTWGDPVSGLVGSGELRSVKDATSLAAMFAVCTLVALPFVGVVPAVFGALGATLADGVKPVVAGYVVDDNLTIPPAAAAGILLGFEVARYVPALPF